MMEKIIGYEAVIDVDGFHDAKNWIYRMIRAGIVKCGQCSEPATNVWWNDAAEWYCRCEVHREYGDQWTGSTRWNPSSFGINVIKDTARAWKETLEPDEQKRVRFHSFDATDYYSLMSDDWDMRTKHYFVGSATEYGRRVYAVIIPMSNGEFVYELHNDAMYEHSGHAYAYGVKGSWATEVLALDAARVDAAKHHLLPDEDAS